MSKIIVNFTFFTCLLLSNFSYANNNYGKIKSHESDPNTLFAYSLVCRGQAHNFRANGYPICRLGDPSKPGIVLKKIPTKSFVDSMNTALTKADTDTNTKLDNVNTVLTTRMDNLSSQLFDLVDKKLEGHVTNQINEKTKTLVNKSINSNEVKSMIRNIVKEELESTIKIQIQKVLKEQLEKEQ